jgi:hypothetical protein
MHSEIVRAIAPETASLPMTTRFANQAGIWNRRWTGANRHRAQTPICSRAIRVFGVHLLSSALEAFLALPRIGARSGHGGGMLLDLARPSDAK